MWCFFWQENHYGWHLLWVRDEMVEQCIVKINICKYAEIKCFLFYFPRIAPAVSFISQVWASSANKGFRKKRKHQQNPWTIVRKKIPEINVDHRKFGQHSTKLTLGWQQFKASFCWQSRRGDLNLPTVGNNVCDLLIVMF